MSTDNQRATDYAGAAKKPRTRGGMSERRLRAILETRYFTKFWGKRCIVNPKFVPTIFGDGKQLIFVTPASSRPNHYFIRVDSSWHESNYEAAPTIGGHIDEILEAIEEYFGPAWYGDEHRNRKYGRPWPALNDGCGVSWGKCDPLEIDAQNKRRRRAR